MNGFKSLSELRFRPSRPWMEFVLPVYTFILFLLYYPPGVLAPLMDGVLSHEILW